MNFKIQSPSEQLAGYLRKQLYSGVWSLQMPGTPRIAKELEIDQKTVVAAYHILEQQGLIKSQGPGRRSKITIGKSEKRGKQLRIAILPYDPIDQMDGCLVELLYLLRQEGHDAFHINPSLTEMKMNARRVAKLVSNTKASAWVVNSASQEVLQGFIDSEIPAFAFFGRRRELPIASAGPEKSAVLKEITGRLVELGHRLICMISRHERRFPAPGLAERSYLEELESHGIRTGSFNLPDWEESSEGINRLMDRLFKVTPPTALLIGDSGIYHAIKHYLHHHGIIVPRDVSLVCTDPDRTFMWCEPEISHIAWDSKPVLRRVVKWANNISRGKADTKTSSSKAIFVEGGTIGPVLTSKRQ